MNKPHVVSGVIRPFVLAVVVGTGLFGVVQARSADVGCCASNTSQCDVLDANYIFCTSDDTSRYFPMYSYCCTAVGDLCEPLPN